MNRVDGIDTGALQTSELRATFLWRAISMLVNCVQLLLAGLVLEFLLFTDTRVPILIRLGVIAFLLAGMARSMGWLLLFACQMVLFVSEPSRSNIAIGPLQFCFCLATLAIVAMAYSKHNSGQILSDWIASRIAGLLRQRQDLGKQLDGTPFMASQRMDGWKQVVSILVQLFVLNLAAIFAASLFLILPMNSSKSRQWLQISLANDGILWPGPTAITAVILLLLLLQYLAWRQLTSAQAGLWLRAGFITHHFRDLAMIVRRRKKMRRKPRNKVS